MIFCITVHDTVNDKIDWIRIYRPQKNLSGFNSEIMYLQFILFNPFTAEL